MVGSSVKRVDGFEKVTGTAQFTVDITLPRMLYGKIKRSPYAHAKIVSIDTSKAKRLSGVKAVMTCEDVPAIRLGTCALDEYIIARDRVRLVGEPVAAVAAETEEIAQEALDLIEVEYEPLPAVFDPEEAMKLDPPAVVHEDYDKYEVLIPIAKMDPRPPNAFQRYRIKRGDFEEALKKADIIVENRYTTGYIHTAPLEPHAAVAEVNSDGTVTVWTSNQAPYIVRDELCSVLQLTPSKVRVIIPAVGGAFGGKLEIKAEPFAVVLAKKSRRPVKIVFTRAEELSATAARTPFIFYIKDAVSKEGKLLGRYVKSIFQGGAYTGEGFLKPIFSTHLYPGSYRFDAALEVDSYGVYTNRIVAGALRGYGCAESGWAIESQMDIIAEKLGIDPVEFRFKNLLQEDEESAITMRMHSFGAAECLRKTAEAIEWGKPSEQPEAGSWKRGKGIALGNKYSFAPTAASVTLKVHEDSSFELRTSAVDLGQGVYTVLTQIVAEEFDIPVEKVKIVTPDTAVTPFDHVAGSSRQTYNTGNAARMACDDAKRQIFERAAKKLEADSDDLETRGGKIYVKGAPDRAIDISDLFDIAILAGKYADGGELLGKATFVQPAVPADPENGQSERPMAYMGHGAQAAEVEVNVETGQVKILKFVSAIDVGKAMNPQGIEMQNHGGMSMGIGIAIHEELVFDGGRITNPSYLDYKIPSICEMPLAEYVKSIIVEQPHREGPYGAKGAGEIVIVPTAPAIGNAIYNAIGVRIYDLPITPDKIVKALREKN